MRKRNLYLALALALIVSLAFAVELLTKPLLIDEKPLETEVTVYNQNFGVVKEYRPKFLDKGLNRVLYSGVAALIDPTSVKLKAVDGVVTVLEQNFQYDLVSREKILDKYLDKNITAYQIYGEKKELIEGELLSQSGSQLILRDKDGGIQVFSSDNLVLPTLPEGLITKPTLEWLVESD